MKQWCNCLVFVAASSCVSAFQLTTAKRVANGGLFSAIPSDVSSTDKTLEDLKEDLISLCAGSSKPSLDDVRSAVRELEDKAEQIGIGQSSSLSGLMNGEWELLFSPEDTTRSSPFFWAFRKAFPDQSDQIFGITDAIPPPVKEVGPAFQTITMDDTRMGTFVSRVKVATLGGAATSIMTTRGSITGIDGVDGLKIRVDTTKPEDSTIVKTLLGPLAAVVNENLPPFPSGEALERIQPGSSQVTMRSTFCDEGLRISRNDDRHSDVFVWRRKGFPTTDVF
eukprot:CAMPEP_0117001900 /NCGR_PEP_ID=MMETSP0472-20121206/3744_1 /TAXON_ID=693140 ORGANISM="Tiarina fusus, Strain LIS" /NCGR_SAMPLE_ID=MMETSP0472 /ASSEMBLY_ACC=CAM_ASM_000603 /LENGTH=279 /DNA_ID=CAMNT_0004702059 /DNA_START=13 /DNA_END=852 /DNA_ORIENTATION=+